MHNIALARLIRKILPISLFNIITMDHAKHLNKYIQVRITSLHTPSNYLSKHLPFENKKELYHDQQ